MNKEKENIVFLDVWMENTISIISYFTQSRQQPGPRRGRVTEPSPMIIS